MDYIIEYFCTSHMGNVRQVNQDNFICGNHHNTNPFASVAPEIITGNALASSSPVFGVFDGMGGEECGEIASGIAVEQLSSFSFGTDPVQELLNYCKNANAEICRYTAEHNLSSMGTTAAILLFSRTKIHLCSIGDSKIFRFSARKLEQISQDHVAAAAYGTKPALTRNLGIPETIQIVSPFISCGDCLARDVYLLCSDGLTDMVSPEEIRQILISSKPSETVCILLNKALENGGKDNITILLLSIRKKRTNLFQKLKNRHNNHNNIEV